MLKCIRRPFLLPGLGLALSTIPLAAEEVSFNRHIRPILTSHCTACHGGVEEAGGVSFVYRESALGVADSGRRPLVPGRPDESEIMRRVTSGDPREIMPPPKHGPSLSDEEIEWLRRWIEAGGEWEEHWSFVAPVEQPVAALSDPAWPTAPLDRHVLAGLDRKGLRPSPEAGPEEWLRRASLDLTGLPPTPEEVAALANAENPAAAREEAVDRLLASPRFGERWAAVWLDLARYADTYGFEKDPHRDIWPYRDWVIRAFNEDMPFDRFTIEQLAGDLLPEPTADQRLATAFHRNTQTNTEGGTDDEEFRVAAVIDRVNTTWTTWQATTFGCVQCHSHPYDPFTHEEYYSFMDLFNQSEDTDLDDDFPKMRVAHDFELRDEVSALERRLAELAEEINDSGRPVLAATEDWRMFVPDTLEPSHGVLETGPDGVVRSVGTLPVGNTHVISGESPDFTALRVTILPDQDDPASWPERGSLVTRFEAVRIDAAGERQPLEMVAIFADHVSGPYRPSTNRFGDFPKLHGPREFVLVARERVVLEPGERLELSFKQDGRTTGDQATPLRQFRVETSDDGRWTAWGTGGELREMRGEMARISQRVSEIPSTHVPVMVERPDSARRETRLFARGNRMSKEQVVSPGVPALLAGGREFGNRLDMAKGLVDGTNPLTARVMANRLWGELFGIGIVESMEDFGSSGTPPSDQALLDHLALRFQDDLEWSVKSLLREIVLSSTYLQTHRASAELVERDPLNRLLARGPRTRLSAEMIRDHALAVSGLLSGKRYGPPVFPPQPDGVWNTVYSGARWNESEGEDRVRRAIYTYVRRTSGYPGFLTFDAPSRDLCSARRISSNTPLQALVTLNDPSFIEAAAALAGRMREAGGDLAGQLAHGVRLATQREPDAEMVEELLALHADALDGYEENPELARALAADPETAAMVLVANVLLNLDTALTK